jgi:hypothetical protein
MSTPETKLTVETCASAYRTDSLLSFHNANREVLRITHDGHIICGEALSANAATQEAAKLLIASFEEQIQEMVNARAQKAEERLKWLEGFLQAGGTSINTVSYYTVENHPDDTDETHFNFPFQIGISVETENRGCYEWVEFSNGAKGLCPAIDAAKIKYAEWQNKMHKGDNQ